MKILLIKNKNIDNSIIKDLMENYKEIEIKTSLKSFSNYKLAIIPIENSYEIKKYTVSIPIICYCSPSDLKNIQENNFADYIVSPFCSQEFIMRIDKLLKKEKLYKLSFLGNKFLINDNEISLTSKEMKIVSILSDNINNFVSREDLNYIINGKDLNKSRALDMHISNIRKKLGKNYCDILVSSYSEGYAIKIG